MQFTFTLLEKAEADEICAWQYTGAYAIYNYRASEDTFVEMLDQRSPYYAVRDELGALVGFFCYGTSAQPWEGQIPNIYSDNEDATIAIGLGLRPDLTGKGLGLAFVNAGLDFARAHFQPRTFRLFVLIFNERAARVYERAGFVRGNIFTQQNMHGSLEFLEMRREA